MSELLYATNVVFITPKRSIKEELWFAFMCDELELSISLGQGSSPPAYGPDLAQGSENLVGCGVVALFPYCLIYRPMVNPESGVLDPVPKPSIQGKA